MNFKKSVTNYYYYYYYYGVTLQNLSIDMISLNVELLKSTVVSVVTSRPALNHI